LRSSVSLLRRRRNRPRARAPTVDAWLLVLLVAAGAAARFAALGHQSFWLDETVTARLASVSFPEMLRSLPRSESAPPLYYALVWCWSRAFGDGEAALRSLSALVGTATVPLAYTAGRELVSRRTGLYAAALAAVSPLLVWYSQEARAYALFVFLAGLSLVLFARALAEASPRAFTWWALVSALALLTHYFAGFLVAGEALLLLRRHRRRAAYVATACVFAVAVALLPLAAYQAKFASSKWIRLVGLGERVQETVGQLLVPSRASIWAGAGVPQGPPPLWWVGVVLLVVATVGAAFLQATPAARRGALTSLALGIAVVGAPAVIALAAQGVSDGRGDVFNYRNVLAAWLPLTVALSAALAAPRIRALGAVVLAGLCAACVAVLVLVGTTPHLQRDDWRLVAAATAAPATAIVLSPSWEVAGLEYYAGGLGPLDPHTRVRTVVLVARRWSPLYPSLRSLDLPPPFRLVERRTLQNWRLTVFRAPVATPVSPDGLAATASRPTTYVLLGRRG
jgi:mannosyltransferase